MKNRNKFLKIFINLMGILIIGIFPTFSIVGTVSAQNQDQNLVQNQNSYLDKLNETNSVSIGEPFGVNHGIANQIQNATAMKNLGVELTRTDMPWSNIERVSGVYDFSGYDKYYENLQAVGIKSIAILDYGNGILFGNNYSNEITDSQLPSWLGFVNATVRHYQYNVSYWEIWNEPNLDKFWSGTDDQFFHVLNETIYLIHEISPGIKILAPGISGYSSQYLDDMITYIGDKTFDQDVFALCFHPYSGNTAQDIRYKDQQVESVAQTHHFTGQIWITEVGKSTQISSPDAIWEQPIQFQTQARELIKAYAITLAQNISKIAWYCYSDSWNINNTYGEACFGLIYRENESNTSWTYKPAGVLYKELSGMLTNSTYLPYALEEQSFIQNNPDNDFSYYFKTSRNTTVAIIWTQNLPYQVILKGNDIASVIQHNILNNSTTILNPNQVTLNINSMPILLEITWKNSDPKNILMIVHPNSLQIFAYYVGPIISFTGIVILFIKIIKNRRNKIEILRLQTKNKISKTKTNKI